MPPFSPKSINVKSIIIQAANGTWVEISNQFVEINIWQDIYKNFTSGNIVLLDAHDLISKVPIVGEETISIIIQKPGSDKETTDTYSTYSVSNRKYASESSQVYQINFCSSHAIINNLTRVSKSYTGTYVDIAKQIFIDSFYTVPFGYIGAQKKIQVLDESQSLETDTVVIPNLHPFDAINWVLSKAHQTHHSANYAFYEISGGFHIRSFNDLVNSKSQGEIFFTPKNIERIENASQNIHNADEFNIVRLPNHLESIRNGTYAATVIEHDMLEKKINTKVYNYKDNFLNSNRLQPGENQDRSTYRVATDKKGFLLNHNGDAFNKRVWEFSESKFYVESEHKYKHDGIDNESNQPASMLRNAYFNQLDSIIVNVLVPGDARLQIGKVVKFNLRSYGTIEDTATPNDKLISGRYLITKARHIIKNNEYTTVLELSKDTYRNTLSTAKMTIRDIAHSPSPQQSGSNPSGGVITQ
jgi:hypothetical protein